MFDKQPPAPPQPQQMRPEDYPIIEYEVKTRDAGWQKIKCHNLNVNDNGTLAFLMVAWADREHTQTRILTIDGYAPGEWLHYKTDYREPAYLHTV